MAIINENGEFRTPYRENYDITTTFRRGYESSPSVRSFTGYIGKKNASIDKKGYEICPPLYESSSIHKVSDSSLLIITAVNEKRGMYYLADNKNVDDIVQILPFEFDELYHVSNYQFIATKNGKSGMYGYSTADKGMRLILPFEHDKISYFWNNTYSVGNDSLMALYGSTSKAEPLKMLLPQSYESINSKNRIIVSSKNGLFGAHYYNSDTGQFSKILDHNYDRISYTKRYHHLIVTKRRHKGLYFYDDKKDRTIERIPLKYNYIRTSGSRNFYAGNKIFGLKYETHYKYSRKQQKVIKKERSRVRRK